MASYALGLLTVTGEPEDLKSLHRDAGTLFRHELAEKRIIPEAETIDFLTE